MPNLTYTQAERVSKLIATRKGLKDLMEAWVTTKDQPNRTGMLAIKYSAHVSMGVTLSEYVWAELVCEALKLIEEDLVKYGIDAPEAWSPPEPQSSGKGTKGATPKEGA